MIRPLMRVVLAWFLAGGTAFAQDAVAPAPSLTANAPTSVRLNEVLVDLPAGTVYASMTGGPFCIGIPVNSVWQGGRAQSKNFPLYRTSFKTVMEHAGYRVVTPGQDNLFDSEGDGSDYEIAGVIADQHMTACAKGIAAKGELSVTIDWQIYARLNKKVVAHVKTSATFRVEERVTGGIQQLQRGCFEENLRQLLDNPDVRTALNARPQIVDGFQVPGRQSKIALAGSLKLGPRKIADATGSVVTILSGLSTGTGFLISMDGYLLTDAHVVGEDKNIRVRWSDGLEGPGTVERVSKNRDVALIKTGSRGRTPLAINPGPITPGQRVYAIGSPKNQHFEGTVTAGIISADRTGNGLRYIQSDVMVSHGSSGGPLLNEKGEVIGLTDLGISNAGPTGEEGQAGLNLFTPIGDAMDFLALEQK